MYILNDLDVLFLLTVMPGRQQDNLQLEALAGAVQRDLFKQEVLLQDHDLPHRKVHKCRKVLKPLGDLLELAEPLGQEEVHPLHKDSLLQGQKEGARKREIQTGSFPFSSPPTGDPVKFAYCLACFFSLLC